MNPPRSPAAGSPEPPSALTAALREARIEAAERTGVVVDLTGAQLARLEILNEALDPLFADIPAGADLFDRGVTPGDPPRLWVDMVAHVAMGHDTRVYRFVQDTRSGRKLLAESAQVEPIVKAVTQYVARRLVERERALAEAPVAVSERKGRQARWWRGAALFVLGMAVGAAALATVAWFAAPRLY
jgi:hypothetical protein